MEDIEWTFGTKAYFGLSIGIGLVVAGEDFHAIAAGLMVIEALVLFLVCCAVIGHAYEKRKLLNDHHDSKSLPDYVVSKLKSSYLGDKGRIAVTAQIIGISAFFCDWNWLALFCYMYSTLCFYAQSEKNIRFRRQQSEWK